MSLTTKKPGVVLWFIQGLLAALFLFAGGFKLALPLVALAKLSSLSAPFLKFIGVCEVTGAIGLILPGLLHIRTELTPLAAAGGRGVGDHHDGRDHRNGGHARGGARCGSARRGAPRGRGRLWPVAAGAATPGGPPVVPVEWPRGGSGGGVNSPCRFREPSFDATMGPGSARHEPETRRSRGPCDS